MKKDERIYLGHIRDAMVWVLQYTEVDRSQFLSDHKTQDAIIREFEIIGEAAKRISDEIRNKYPDIPWRKMAGLRDKSIHEYEGVNIMLYWELAKKEIPSLKARIDQVLKELGEPEK